MAEEVPYSPRLVTIVSPVAQMSSFRLRRSCHRLNPPSPVAAIKEEQEELLASFYHCILVAINHHHHTLELASAENDSALNCEPSCGLINHHCLYTELTRRVFHSSIH